MIRELPTLRLFVALFLCATPALAQSQSSSTKSMMPVSKVAAPEQDIAPAMTEAPKQAPIATLGALEGSNNVILRADENGASHTAKINDTLYQNDIIQTGMGAKALIVMLDGSRFTLAENSRFMIENFIYDDLDTASNAARYNLLQGGFLYTGGALSNTIKPDTKIVTPHGAIAVRDNIILWAGTLDDQFSVFLDQGEIALESNRGRIRMIAGDGTSIRNANAIPERPKQWGADKVTRAKATIGLKDMDAAKSNMAVIKEKQQMMIEAHKDFMRAQNQYRIEQQSPRDSIKRLDNKPQNPSVVKVAPEAIKRAEPAISKDVEKIEGEKTKKESSLDTPFDSAPPAEEPKPVLPPPPAEEKAETLSPQFPTPSPSVQPDASTLPDDPAMRQEQIEKMNLQKPATKIPDPF